MCFAQAKGARTIMLNARLTAIGFYEKHGFCQVGEIYDSTLTGVPHIKMVYRATS